METFIITLALVANLLTGTVSDQSSKEILAGVRIQYGQEYIYTDLDGKFTLQIDSIDKISLNLISYSDTTLILNNQKCMMGDLLK